MTLSRFREGSWDITLIRDERSGNSRLEAEVSKEGVSAKIICTEKDHLNDADVFVEFIRADGTHVNPEITRHLHREGKSPTVLSSAAAYMIALMKEIGDNPAVYLESLPAYS